MKIEVNEKDSIKKAEYPCLMKYENDLIVLFKSKSEGTVLCRGESIFYTVGEYHDNWNVKTFTPFNGTITLQND